MFLNRWALYSLVMVGRATVIRLFSVRFSWCPSLVTTALVGAVCGSGVGTLASVASVAGFGSDTVVYLAAGE